MAVNSAGNLFIADTGNQRVRKVSPDGIINTVAGNGIACCFSGDGGPATGAQLNYPWDVAVDGAGNVFIADSLNYRILRVDKDLNVYVIAGGGTTWGDGVAALNVALIMPRGVAVDKDGNVYFTEPMGIIRKLTPQK